MSRKPKIAKTSEESSNIERERAREREGRKQKQSNLEETEIKQEKKNFKIKAYN